MLGVGLEPTVCLLMMQVLLPLSHPSKRETFHTFTFSGTHRG